MNHWEKTVGDSVGVSAATTGKIGISGTLEKVAATVYF
jgi:hypothetical protein